MLAKQEEDRQREIKAREERQQMFMNRLADTVIKEMDNKAAEEEMKIKKYELQREMAERKAEEMREDKKKKGYDACKKHLFRQMEERRKRDIEEAERNAEQAKIWEKDRQNYMTEEERIKEKVKKLNHDTADFLRSQMSEQRTRHIFGKMNRTEFLYNKHVLRNVNEKLREHSGSQERNQTETPTPPASHK